MKREKDIQAKLIEMTCEHCGKGVYRQTGVVNKQAHPINYEHACSNCERKTNFTVGYPLIEYKDKKFMLADSLRFLGERKGPNL